jgi:hypothetical protein
MKAQYKYALRHGVVLRYTTFGIVFAINLVFGMMAFFDVLPFAAAVTAVSLSGTGLGVVVIVNLIAGAANIGSILSSPSAYIYALAPVKNSKVLFARLSAVVVHDFLTLAVNIFGVVWLSLYLAGTASGSGQLLLQYILASEVLTAFFLGLAYYTYLYTLIVFCIVVKNSLLFSIKGRALLAIICGFATYWVLSFMDFSLIPFADVFRWGLFFNLSIYTITGTIVHGMLVLLKAAILFFVTSKLMDRRMNY